MGVVTHISHVYLFATGTRLKKMKLLSWQLLNLLLLQSLAELLHCQAKSSGWRRPLPAEVWASVGTGARHSPKE